MKKTILIALVLSGLAALAVHRSKAQVPFANDPWVYTPVTVGWHTMNCKRVALGGCEYIACIAQYSQGIALVHAGDCSNLAHLKH